MTRRSADDEESVFAVADKVLRMQVEWMVQHAGMRKEFPVIMRRIWWSYLTAALPDVADGVEQVLLSEPLWMQRLREVDLACLFDVPLASLRPLLVSWEKIAFPESRNAVTKKNITRTRHTRQPSTGNEKRNIAVRLCYPRLLALVGLGLLLCGEHTLISDLLRWIRTLQYPYINPELSPEEFASYNRINENRKICVPLYANIEWLMALLCRTLKLQPSDFPPVGVAPVVARFVEELNLPKAMVGFVMGVAEQLHTTELQVEVEPGGFYGSWKRSRGVEALVMACMVCAMRIMFGMDGESELKISEATVSLRSLLGTPVQLFNFSEWVRHIEYRRLQLFRHTHLLPLCTAKAELFLDISDPMEIASAWNSSRFLSQETWRLQRRLGDTSDGISEYPVVVLAPTHRPFRAHTEALAKIYPRLSVDFTDASIQHLLKDEALPKTWKIARSQREEGEECWAKLRGAQIAGKDTCPYRSQTWMGEPSKYVQPSALMDEVPSYSMRWLLEVCAEIIEHSPERLLREVLYLELGLFEKCHPARGMGKASASISKMITG